MSPASAPHPPSSPADRGPQSDPITDLDATLVAAALAGRRVGCLVHALASVSSTMDEAARLAAAGAPDGTVVLADHQTAGRGRLGRRWEAPPGTALLLSVLFRPPLPPERWPELAMAVGLGVLDALEAAPPALPPGMAAALKWPNDVVVGDAKLGGLLSESRPAPGGGTVIVGLGLNMRQLPDQLPPGAASLVTLGAVPPRRDRLAAVLLASVDDACARLLQGRSLVEEWSARLSTLGRVVTASAATGAVTGHAVGVDRAGALVIEDADGRRHTVLSGDVTLSALR